MNRERLLELLKKHEDEMHRLIADASAHKGASDVLRLLLAELDNEQTEAAKEGGVISIPPSEGAESGQDE